MPTTYTIQILPVAHQEMRGPGIYLLDRLDEWEPFQFHVLVVRGGGKTILINTGPPQDLGFLDPYWPLWPAERPIQIADHERLDHALASAQVEPADVDVVIVSPLIFYATGNIDRFPNAHICLLKRGWIDFHAPPLRGKYMDSVRELVMPARVAAHLVTDAWPRVRLLEDEDEVLPGITTFFSGVHHRSSMAVRIATPRGMAIFSDSFFKFRNIEEDVPVGYLENLEEAFVNYERIRREADLFLPAFDPELMTRYAGGRIG